MKKSTKIKMPVSDRVFSIINVTLLIIFAFTCLYPFVFTASQSLSSVNAVNRGIVYLFPVGFNIDAYKAVFQDSTMVKSMGFTIELTVIYTLLSLAMTALCAYPLSKKRLGGRSFLLIFVMITMYVNGGMIPTYLLISKLELLDSMWALILPGVLSTYNMIIMKTFFSSIPGELEEAAIVDGANEWTIFSKIYLPLSKSILATIGLFYAVAKWNGFQDALYYITDPKLFPLQLKLRQLISLNDMSEMENMAEQAGIKTMPETLKAASLMFATVPILVVYPWLQKYFVKGVMIGSVKG